MKTLCDFKRSDIESQIDHIIKIVSKPKFICKKCARVAKDKKYLCKAEALIGEK
ncbi:hypothetical protein [Sulfurimonas sp. C5]|uniref:hypothetical protein n=1 Tax=Sulfurimonas sp. C5 TaxID=3036947 RepID=UPI002455C86C|nr:hypothetical protein [Sulfurimonas sp. C5]MDH4943891.1 hypothetical protein [Sulfurimonas sp. C5]